MDIKDNTDNEIYTLDFWKKTIIELEKTYSPPHFALYFAGTYGLSSGLVISEYTDGSPQFVVYGGEELVMAKLAHVERIFDVLSVGGFMDEMKMACAVERHIGVDEINDGTLSTTLPTSLIAEVLQFMRGIDEALVKNPLP